jgi:DNA-binding beta-propeller fold protein YncE
VKKSHNNSIRSGKMIPVLLAAMALILIGSVPLYGANKKKSDTKAPEKSLWERIDISKIVWPNPPQITRVRYLNYFSAEKIDAGAPTKKAAWMDRLAGVTTGETRASKPHYELMAPYGLAVDSKGNLYVADEKVGAIFIFNTETREVDLIKNGTHARFNLISGLAIDDSDRVFVSDSVMRHVLVFDKQHRAEASVNEGLASPAGIAVDNENRFLYVADTDLDQVLVYDADPPFKLLRKIGTTGQKHQLTTPGDFSYPTNVAVDKDGNLYVSDTFNDRIEVFDAEGKFIRTFGKAGDGPGYFARPKGIAIDRDGHVWVADGVQDRIQVFTPEGRLLLWIGGHGLLPGQFSALAGLTIDKNDRVFSSEQFVGRVQMFRYVNDDEAKVELERREGKKPAAKDTAQAKSETSTANKP